MDLNVLLINFTVVCHMLDLLAISAVGLGEMQGMKNARNGKCSTTSWKYSSADAL